MKTSTKNLLSVIGITLLALVSFFVLGPKRTNDMVVVNRVKRRQRVIKDLEDEISVLDNEIKEQDGEVVEAQTKLDAAMEARDNIVVEVQQEVKNASTQELADKLNDLLNNRG